MSIISEIHKDLEQGAVRLIAEHRDRLMSEAVRLCGDFGTAEDLVSLTFAKAVHNIDAYKKDDNFFGWLKTIMGNIHKSELRRPVARGTTPVDPEILAADDKLVTNETEERILEDSDHDALRKAVERLPSIYRNAVVLHYFEEFSIKDIAMILKAPEGTIFRRLNVARKLLAKDLAVKLGKKKPLAVLFAVLLGVGTLFGAWQAVEAILASPTPTPTTTPSPSPSPSPSTSTSSSSAADPTAPVMTYPTFSSETTISTEPISTKQEVSTMTTIKKTLLAAVSAVSLASTANAVDVEAVKGRVVPAGITAQDMTGGFTYEYKKDGVKYGVAVFVADGSWTVLPNITSIDCLVVGGGGGGGGQRGGGGGAGGFLYQTDLSVTPDETLTVTIGAGGAGGTRYDKGKKGDSTTLVLTGQTITAQGGGYGGYDAGTPGDGASGGGAPGNNLSSYSETKGGTSTAVAPEQGNPGGDRHNTSTRKCGAGGGGAGGKGGDVNDGKGGEGLPSTITGETVLYAVGGAGGAGNYEACEGAANTGNGGGGGGSSSGGYAGGSGIVVIRWEIPVVRSQVTVVTSGSGSVSGADEYAEGETVTLVATANDGSHFAGWEGAPAGATTIEETTLTFTMGMVPVAITAKFDEDLAKGVTILAEGGNYGTPDPAYEIYAEYADGTERTYMMAETVIGEGSEKIYLAGWKLLDGEGKLVRNSDTGLRDGESISLIKFTCGTDEAFTLVWRWEPRYTLTATANPAEGGTITGVGDYAAGATVTLTANVTGGYKLTGWAGAPDDATEDGSTLTFTMPAVPTTVTANFEMVPWGITVVSGTTTNDYRNMCVPGTPYQFQSPLYYIVQEGELRKRCIGYTLTPMREDGVESELFKVVPEGETLTATVTYAEPVRLTWKWADDYYFTLAQDGEGTVTGPADGWYASGTEFTLTATPAKNYEFLCWMGSVSGTDTTITGTITAKTSVKALFSPVQQVKSDWEAIEGKPAMMRTVKSLGKTYCVVKFTDSTTFDIPKKVTSIDCLVVGGGGSGGANRGGGGGAGGFLYQTGLAVTPGETLRVTVGAGGEVGNQYDVGKVGKATTLEITGQTITAQGGGGGGRENAMPKNGDGDGASGGGVGGNNSADSYPEIKGGASTAVAPEQGNPGGDRTVTVKQKCGAGGGGAGGKGGDVADGKGGDGLPSTITGETVWYAAGGAGGGSDYSPGEGAANTGNGGGGSSSSYGNAGGSGVVIIRYALPSKGVVFMIY